MAPKRINLTTPQKMKWALINTGIPASVLGAAKQQHQMSERITPIKQKKTRNLDREVQKCLLDNFKKFNSKQTDQLAPGSQDKPTLRQRLRRDKEMLQNHDPDAPIMGKRYYQVLRDAYQNMTSPSKRWKPDEDAVDFAVDQTLKDACLGISASPVDIGLMTDFAADQNNLPR